MLLLQYLAVGAFGMGAAAYGQSYGLDARSPIGAFLNGHLPSSLVVATGDWATAVAFPNLTFDDATFLAAEPRSTRLYVCGREGVIWSFTNNPGTAVKTVFLDLSAQTQGWESCGLLGMAFHPEFGVPASTNRGFVYVFYSYAADPSPGPRPPGLTFPTFLRLSRFTVPDGAKVADPRSELVLVNQYDRHIWHNGGSVFFGQDGFLYFAIGDEGGSGDPYNSTQTLTGGLFSGVFRIDVNQNPSRSHPIRRQPRSGGQGSPPSFTAHYFVPNDNPFLSPDGAVLEEYWALGLRSPHRTSYDPVSGQIWVGDVGQDVWEEVTLIRKGANCQWAYREGLHAGPKPQPNPLIGSDQPPVLEYIHSLGNNCVIGGYVYRGSLFAELVGKYLFGDNGSGRIWAMTWDGVNPPAIQELCRMPSATTWTGLSSFGLDQSGEVYFCKMGLAQPLYRLVRNGPPPPLPPPTLSQTGAFANLATLTPSTGLIPYGLNAPFWSDGAAKRRWIAVPNDGAPYSPGEQVTFAPTGEWAFPAGTVLVKHFELPIDESNPALVRRLETRFIVRDSAGGVYGVTYRWRPDQSDADLLHASQTEPITILTAGGGTRTQTWYYPSPQDCLTCHNPNAGYVLGPSTRQLNRDYTYPVTGRVDNQLRAWNHVGMFNPAINEAAIPTFARLTGLADTTASLEVRVRSYLDANCAQCHRPGGVFAYFDARFDTPLASQNIVNGPVAEVTAAPGSRIVVPGSLPLSLMHVRVSSSDPARQMPPLARNVVDAQAVTTLAQWIQSLPPGDNVPAPWQDLDIGTVGFAGSATYDAGTFTVTGSGADIWQPSDGFHFVYQTSTGDGEIVARVTSLQNTSPWAKAGVMMRANLGPGSPHALMLVSASQGTGFQRRLLPDGTNAWTAGAAAAAPYWVRLVRAGDRISAYGSVDGRAWTLVGSELIALGTTLDVGLAVTAHNNSALTTARFTDVQVSGGWLPPPWASADVGSTAVAGSAAYSAGVFTVSGSGADIWSTADGFQYVSRTWTGDGEIIAQVTGVENTQGFAKAGVMFRASPDAGAPHAMMLVTPTQGVGFEWRASANGLTMWTAGPRVAAPYWVRLVRAGNLLSAYGSPDGTQWTLVDVATVALPPTAYAGLAVTAHDNTTLCTATFANVQAGALSAPRLSLQRLDAAGRMRIGVTGVPGQVCTLTVSPDFAQWSDLGRVTNQVAPVFYQDDQATNFLQRFYRARVP